MLLRHRTIIIIIILVWMLNNYYKKRLIALEIDYLRRSARIPKLNHSSYKVFKERMTAEENILEGIGNKSLTRFGHIKDE